MKPKVVRYGLSLPHWILWVLCIFLVVPALLGVPGKPKLWELLVYIAAITSITHYPILLPIFAILEGRARRQNDLPKARTFRMAIWVIFALTSGILGTIAGVIYANTPPPRVLSEDERIEEAYVSALLHHDIEALKALVESGADIEHRMFADGTPASVAALHHAWIELIYLLEKGADPDRADMGGHTARSTFARAEPPPGDDDYARAYWKLKEIFATNAPPRPMIEEPARSNSRDRPVDGVDGAGPSHRISP